MKIADLINLIKPFLPLGADAAHKSVERVLTIPKKDFDKLCAGMNVEDAYEAARLQTVFTDAASDFAVFVASRGAIEADQ